MSNFNTQITAAGKSSPVLPTIPCQVMVLLNGQCDSATLELQKFPDLNKTRLDKREAMDYLQKFCKQVENSKRHLPAHWGMPEISGIRKFSAINRGRLLINHTGGIIENSNLALHRFFGFPYIPGSALKGIARSAATFDEDTDCFKRVFGGAEKGKSDRAGSVAFLAAYPADKNWKLVMDILTTHHGCDTQNPTPVPFLAVECGATFNFMIAPTARTEDGDLDFAEDYLKIALAENGVGAKTAAGYGWFEIKECI